MTAKAILDKYGIKPTKSKKANEALAKRTADIVKEEIVTKALKGPSRNDLMLQAKAKGIKNFRILNKEELVKVLNAKDTIDIETIVAGAVQRWKSGFGNRSKKETE